MINLTPLPMSGADVRDQCVSGIADAGVRTRILNDEAIIASEERAFRTAISMGTVRSLTPVAFNRSVKKDMKWLYEQRFVSSTVGKPIWNKILKLSGDKCPLCHIAKSKTLDHSIPKSVHPRLSVDPLNLVPACRDCNLGRNTGHSNMSLSPYIDMWAVTTPWLIATIPDLSHPEDLNFAAKRDPSFTEDQWLTLQEFFEETDLGSRYSNLAIDEFLPLHHFLRANLDMPLSIDDVISALHERRSSYLSEIGPNRWQTAAYSAWATAARQIGW